jgi:hypothetical protein
MRDVASSDRLSRSNHQGSALNKFFGMFKASSSSFDSDADYRLRLAETTQSMLTVPAVREILLKLGAIVPVPSIEDIKALCRDKSTLQQLIEELGVDHAKDISQRLCKAARKNSRDLEVLVRSLQLKERIWTTSELAEAFKKRPDIQAHLSATTQYTTSKWLLEQELKGRGKWVSDGSSANLDAYEIAAHDPDHPVGLCLSGGGIRSATFNLGVLQGLSRLGLLPKVEYLSSVSGGGYIHHFLAAWITRRSSLLDVQAALNPIPSQEKNSRGEARVMTPEPISWLRRYSNYLSPSIALFGTDMWTIAAVWVRNTLLNLIVLLSTLLFLLMLPHLFVSTSMTIRSIVESDTVPVIVLIISFAVGFVFFALDFPEFGDAVRDKDGRRLQPKANKRKSRTQIIELATLIAALSMTNAIYRSAIPGGSSQNLAANDAYKDVDQTTAIQYNATYKVGDETHQDQIQLNLQSKQKSSLSRLRRSWMLYHPGWIWPTDNYFHPWDSRAWRSALLDRHLIIHGESGEKELYWPIALYSLGSGLIGLVLVWRIKEGHVVAKVIGSIISPIVAIFLAVLMIQGLRVFFFVLTFTIGQDSFPRLAITVLPALLMAVPFICVELITGLLGTLLGSAQREWIARLRAEGSLLGLAWFFLVGISLISPQIFDRLTNSAIASYGTWSVWLASTITGVLLGRSRNTNGEAKDDAGNSGFQRTALKMIATTTPIVFILGLFVLLAKVGNWLLSSVPSPHVAPDDISKLITVLVVLAAIACIFSWRIDVNEFSMNTFYRDRLARCYAGASNPRRNPNPFTGFDKEDGALRVTDLLPTGWKDFEQQEGKYEGPFPIFCTSVNLTTGKDLSYQERKAGSFCITPLCSGYSTGWTEGVDDTIRYNGFVPTTQHIKKNSHGMTVASAVAISGAAASPNMGYHSSLPLAFLMTIFNVRLGWWLRNTRRIGSGADSPRIGLLRLVGELLGRTSDTEQYIYLSDGGHFDNMGLYELLRRRCRTIVICDAECDGDLNFEGIGGAIRKARLDFGVEIELMQLPQHPNQSAIAPLATKIENVNSPVKPPTKSPEKATAPAVQATDMTPTTAKPSGAEGVLLFEKFPGNTLHALEGTITYPESPNQKGRLLYIKSTLTGDEPVDILNYHRIHQAFPFDSTMNQFFTESQFESYRRLGQHIVLEDRYVRSWLEAIK